MIKQELEVAVCALQRSGHHAVMYWLSALLRGRLGVGTIMYANWINQALPQLDPFNSFTGHTDDAEKLTPGHRDAKRKGLIYNYEDCGLHMLRSMQIHSKVFNGESAHRFNVVVLRDFYNLLASRMERTRKGRPLSHSYRVLSGLWLEHADTTVHDSIYTDTLDNLITINYNDWFTSEQYRRDIANRLACPYTEATMDRVHFAGNGSSFTGMSGNGRSLDVLNRWKKFADDKEFINAVNHPAIQCMNHSIFGWALRLTEGKLVRYKKE